MPWFTDPNGRQTLADSIDPPGIYAAGRLDLDSEGLLLLTSDGRLAHHITDPQLSDRKTKPAGLCLLPDRLVPIRFRKSVPTAWLEITLREGLNRQFRRMTVAVGHPTLRLMRVPIGPIVL